MRILLAEWRVVLSVAAVLLLLEGVMRGVRTRLSGDIEHLEALDDRLATAIEPGGFSIVFGGNSLVGDGIAPDIVADAIGDAVSEPTSIVVVRPDGTSPLEWRYLYRRLLFNPGVEADALVLGFGPGHLRDRPASAQALRLAMHHVGPADRWSVVSSELSDFESRARFILATGWTTYGVRDRVSARVYAEAIPGYREHAGLLLQSGPAPASPSEPTYHHLERLLADAQAADIPVVLVKMPAPQDYDVEPGVVALARRAGVPIVDVNPIGALPPERFPDGEHLDPSGRRIFSEALAPALAAAVRGSVR